MSGPEIAPNPYDFANPVTDPGLFAGRQEELDDIRYYLDHAKGASRPINIAIIGERAAGKTSLLNMIASEAGTRDFLVVRIELDEGDADSQLSLFHKIFDAALTTACEAGYFHGINGRTYDDYRNTVDAFEIPEDRSHSPFGFPMQYAKALGAGRPGALVSDAIFKNDMKRLADEVKKPVALLFDECDVLAQSRTSLQKLRNVFMNTSGFMLVLCGTPKLFPVMDDVFSPIVRQFKKIGVHPFETREQTRECIENRLKGESESLTISEEDVDAIHNFSGGRPYEIQLLCHFLFRRMQRSGRSRLQLGVEVLDDVLLELEKTQDITARPIVTAVRKLESTQLNALQVLGVCDRATLDQIWFGEYVFSREHQWTKDELERHLGQLVDLGILSVEDDFISFRGDEFDRIYCKYHARKQEVRLTLPQISFERHLANRLRAYARRNIGSSSLLVRIDPLSQGAGSLAELAASLREDSDVPPTSGHQFAMWLDLYWLCADFRSQRACTLLKLLLTSEWCTVRADLRPRLKYDDIRGASGQELIQQAQERIGEFGGELDVEEVEIEIIPMDVLADNVDNFPIELRRTIGGRHHARMVDAHLEDGDHEEALFHAELAYRYVRTPPVANNVGYIYLVNDDLVKARECFNYSLDDDSDDDHFTALCKYNLGVLEAKEGNFKAALEALEIAASKADSSTNALCLVIPKLDEESGRLDFKEERNPLVSNAVASAQSAILAYQQK